MKQQRVLQALKHRVYNKTEKKRELTRNQAKRNRNNHEIRNEQSKMEKKPNEIVKTNNAVSSAIRHGLPKACLGSRKLWIEMQLKITNNKRLL